MKNWYKSAPVKGILLIVEHVLAVVMVVCMIFILMYPGQEYGDAIDNLSKTDYADTKGFKTSMLTASHDILGQIETAGKFETEGKYDPDKVVDIVEYSKSGKLEGDSKSGIAYRLGDLTKWSADYEGDEEPKIVVCQRPDKTFEYFKFSEFSKKIEAGELRFVSDQGKEYLEALKEGNVYEGYYSSENEKIVNAENEIVYEEFWNFYGGLKERFKTVDGKTILDIVNTVSEWNGKLGKVCDDLRRTLDMIGGDVENYQAAKHTWEEGNTNLTYLFADLNSGRLYSNRQKYKDIRQMQAYMEELAKSSKYVIAAPKLIDFQTNMDTEADSWCTPDKLKTDNYIYMVAVDTSYPIQDQFYVQNKLFDTYAPYMNTMLILGAAAVIAFFVVLVWLTAVAGRTTQGDGVSLMWFDRIKTEIAAVVIIAVWVGIVAMLAEYVDTWMFQSSNRAFEYTDGILHGYGAGLSNMVLLGLIAVVSCAGLLTGYLSVVRRIKAKTLWKNSVIYWFVRVMKKFFQYRSCTFKATVIMLSFIVVHWIAIGTGGQSGWMFITFLAEGAGLYFMLRGAIAKQKIKRGIRHIAEGNVEYQIPLDGLKGDNLDIASAVNHIGEGLSKAVEQSMKDERLKTDLITNVSHDIKTPLTSIINYVDLLKRENIQDPKIQGYLDILEAKAQRLKNLTEDVVEASKISSGNITMEYMNINFVEMINQTTGEFAEKFEKRNLQIVLNVPDHPVVIRSDGRRMWRVIENIYNNAAKYALEGTRVYADLVEKEETVEFSLKNISEQPLNISADELTERFIRGDVSRSTEGSGLGLSIAKNLTKMQGGEFNLYLDGDLFKVTIVFPKV